MRPSPNPSSRELNPNQIIWKLQSDKDQVFAISLVHDLATGKIRFNNSDQLSNVCKSLAKSVPKALALNINQITNDSYLQFQVTRECVRNLGSAATDILSNLKNTAIRNSDHKTLIAIESARSGNFEDIIKVALENGISFDNHRLALAKVCCLNLARTVKFFKLDIFQKLSAQEKFELYEHAITSKSGWQFREYRSKFPEFSPKQKKELLASLAKNRPQDLGEHIDYLRPATEEECFKVLSRLIKAEPESAAIYYTRFQISSERFVIAALTQIALLAPAEFADSLKSFKLSDRTTELLLSSIVTEAVKQKSFQQLSLLLDKSFNELNKGDAELAWTQTVDFLRSKNLIPDRTDLLDARVDTFSQRYQALAAICFANGSLQEAKQEVPLSRAAIQSLSGFPEKIFNCAENSQSLGELYLNIFNELSYPQQKRVLILQEPVAELKQINSLLSLSKAYGCLKTALGAKPKQFKVNSQNADKLIVDLQAECRELLSELFEVQISENVDLAKNADNIVAVAILASRYQENPEWNCTMPVLKEIIEHMVKGTFSKYKYSDAEQLSFLSEEQKEIWKETSVSLKVISPEDISQAAIVSKVSSVLKNNLMPHAGVSINQNDKIEIDHNILSDDRKFIKFLASLSSQKQKAIFALQLMSQFCENNDLANLKLLVARINSAQGQLFKDLAGDFNQIKKDLADIKTALRSENQTSKNEFLSLCLITDDPYTLFTIGKAVEAASCQSYTNGCYANTLPAYVIDGNIQAALNFVVPLSKLGALAEILKKDPEAVELKLDLVNRKVTLNHSDLSSEILLDKALSRRILRLGYVELAEKEAVLFPEVSYYQVHGVREQGDQQLLSLIQKKAEAMGAYSPEAGEEINFPATRNTSQGIYVDSSKDDAIQISEYKLFYPVEL